jgi:hypothetical protein
MSRLQVLDLVLIGVLLLGVGLTAVREVLKPAVPPRTRKDLLIPLMPIMPLVMILVHNANLAAKVAAAVFCLALFGIVGRAFDIFRMDW